MPEFYTRPTGLVAGFAAHRPSDRVPELVSTGEQWAPADFEIAQHAHAVWELYLQLDGTVEWIAEGQGYELGPGTGYVVSPGVEHRLRRQRDLHCPRGLIQAWTEIREILRRQKRDPTYEFTQQLPARELLAEPTNAASSGPVSPKASSTA